MTALEWECYRCSVSALVKKILWMPWPCSMALTSVFQMCKFTNQGAYQMPDTCPWCETPVSVAAASFFSQTHTYLDHVWAGQSRVHTYTGVRVGGSVEGHAVSYTLDLLDDKLRDKIFRHVSTHAVCFFAAMDIVGGRAKTRSHFCLPPRQSARLVKSLSDE